jgi:hypothetical protein
LRERGPGPGWDFRWQDTSSNPNWISTLDAMIASGQIELTLPPGDSCDSDVSGWGGGTAQGAAKRVAGQARVFPVVFSLRTT